MKRTCKVCNIEKEYIKAGRKPCGQRYYYTDENGSWWASRVCPQCSSRQRVQRGKDCGWQSTSLSHTKGTIERFIKQAWGNLNSRCVNGTHPKLTDKNSSYHSKNIRLDMTRDEFTIWCYAKKDIFESLDRPSLDRIDSHKSYSIGNLQLIELAENIAKDKTTFKDGRGVCRVCKISYPLKMFSKDKRRRIGHVNICIMCDTLTRKNRYECKKRSASKVDESGNKDVFVN